MPYAVSSHWFWALNLPGNLTSMNWLLSGLPDCHGLGLGQLGHPGAQRQQTSDFVSTNIPNFCQATSPNWRGGSQAMEHFHQTCQMSRKIVEPFLSVLVPRCQWFRIRQSQVNTSQNTLVAVMLLAEVLILAGGWEQNLLDVIRIFNSKWQVDM